MRLVHITQVNAPYRHLYFDLTLTHSHTHTYTVRVVAVLLLRKSMLSL